MNLDLKLDHVYIMVGPSGCGKSFLSQIINKQIPFAHIISSDNWRRFVLKADCPKNHPKMMHASSAAFKYLFTDLEQSISYPQSLYNKIIIVDTTGLNKTFREEVKQLATKYNYKVGLIVFDYKNKEDYFLYKDNENENSTSVISKHVKNLKENLGEIKQRKFTEEYISISSRIPNDIKINILYLDEYIKHLLPIEEDYFITTDIHCRFDLLIELLKQSKTIELDSNNNISKGKLIINGDWTDKNVEQLPTLINWLYLNKEHIYLILGNHELFNYRVLTGEHSQVTDREKIYFDSYPILEKDEELKNKFFELIERSYPFLLHPGVSIHHSPCKTKYIGKLDKISIEKQIRNRYLFKKDFDSLEEYTTALQKHINNQEDSDLFSANKIVNGHIKSRSIYFKGNRILLDIGAEVGHGLAGLHLYKNTYNISDPIQYINNESKKNDLINLYQPAPKEFTEIDLSKTKEYLTYNPVNYLMCTLSPAASCKKTNDLESLEEALNYYKDNKVDDLVIQLKRMGSNCVLYINKELEQCYATTRNGYVINHIPSINDLLKEWHSKIFNHSEFKNKTEVILLGELEPWSILDPNKSFLEQNFTLLHDAIKEKNNYLINSGLYDTLVNLSNQERNKANSHDQKLIKLSRKLLQQLNNPNETSKNLEIFKSQLEAYYYEAAPFFTPFNILKVDNLIFPYNNYEGWNLFNLNGVERIKSSEIKKAYEIFNNWNTNCEELFNLKAIEGVVVKPLNSKLKNILPAIKVRTKEYLHLVYGINYPMHLDSLIKNKKVYHKRKLSLEQWQLGLKMLETNKDNLLSDRHIYLTCNFRYKEKEVEKLDPTL